MSRHVWAMMQSTAPRTVMPFWRSERNRRAARTWQSTDGLNHRQRQENSPGSPETAVGPESLKDLRDDDRNDSQVLLFLEGDLEALHVRIRSPIEEVRPEALSIRKFKVTPQSFSGGNRSDADGDTGDGT